MENLNFTPYRLALSAKKFDTAQSLGRVLDKNQDEDGPYFFVMNPYLLDKTKILSSKCIRRSSGKNQVFSEHRKNSHLRNRLIHTHEVVSISVQMAEILGLNVYLTEAIAFGHDLGHTPFGHLGENMICSFSARRFRHEIMSVVIAQKIERDGGGLNLSYEVLEGILYHSRGKNGLQIDPTLPLEYSVVMLADKIAYTFADLNDAISGAYFEEKDLPKALFSLGKDQRERCLSCIFSLVKESSEKGIISFSDSDAAQKMEEIRQWSFKNLYEKIDRTADRKVLEVAHRFLLHNFSNPLLIFALLTDGEAIAIADLANGKIKEEPIFMDFLRKVDNYQVDIFSPDLVKENFKKVI